MCAQLLFLPAGAMKKKLRIGKENSSKKYGNGSAIPVYLSVLNVEMIVYEPNDHGMSS